MKLSIKDMLLVSLFAALMVVGAYVKILFPIMPLTLQPFFCGLAGILLGSRLGALSQGIYLFIGLTGIPVFTQGGGPFYVLKPSFGFLLGFVAAAWVIGKSSERLRVMNLGNALISMFAGLFALYALGLPYMYIILKFYLAKPGVTLGYVIAVGFLTPIGKDIVMTVLAALLAVRVVPLLRRGQRFFESP